MSHSACWRDQVRPGPTDLASDAWCHPSRVSGSASETATRHPVRRSATSARAGGPGAQRRAPQTAGGLPRAAGAARGAFLGFLCAPGGLPAGVRSRPAQRRAGGLGALAGPRGQGAGPQLRQVVNAGLQRRGVQGPQEQALPVQADQRAAAQLGQVQEVNAGQGRQGPRNPSWPGRESVPSYPYGVGPKSHP